ncbi:conserved oligomeric Golgi complex subunit 2 [Geosmithia morbida]|uniref:Conserved oligomeric Golgi complex subunit 2 n=1 Tax=Geosmithia morbida TaxID=1094350 RepID=A0A9P4YRG2_9HYPO|nr:conserved oligomeric Golgi complex subunit 2 [Geosmithia morbida]KAF4120715.1 conserved oligomeric Golgi complex subunit 2 [Geosmithia morbida]
MANLAARPAAVFNLSSSTNTPPASSIGGGRDDLAGDADDDDDLDNDDDVPLPFPAALPRSDFLKPDFEPAEYLSALPHRHQTLEDLRSDLRERSSAISTELLELVNSNYTAFLSLGTELRGGDDKVEDVRVAMLGFRRAVEDVRAGVAQRRDEAARLNDDLRRVRSGIQRGRDMLELSDRLASLEDRLVLGSTPAADADGDDDDTWSADSESNAEEEGEERGDDDASGKKKTEGGGGLVATSPSKLSVLAQECRRIMSMMAAMDQDHPFVIRQEERLMRCRNTLLLDLGNALKEARAAGPKGQDRVIKYLAIYRVIDAQGEAIKLLKRR